MKEKDGDPVYISYVSKPERIGKLVYAYIGLLSVLLLRLSENGKS